MAMEVTSVISFIFKIASDIHDRAELATECTQEASRIARRIRHLVATLDSATNISKNDATLQLMLVELRTFLDSIPPLLCKCVQPVGKWEALKLIAHVKPLAKALAKKEIELERLTSALSLHMLTTIGGDVKNAGADTVAQISAKMQDLDICGKEDVRRIVETALHRKLVHVSLPETSTTTLTGEGFGRISKDDLVQDETPFAEGTFGFVYGGTYCGKSVAIKKAKFDLLPLKETLVFRREAELHFAMRHPNVVEVFGYSSSSPVCLIMERMNETLSDFLGLDLTIPFANKVSILEGVAEGLRFLHSVGIVHMDVKSPNILLDEEGTPKLSDFGLAQVASRVNASSASSTTCKVGSYMWMAPEVHSSGHVSREADVFSFAVVAHEVMTQKTPPRGMPLGLAKSFDPRVQLVLGDVEGALYMGPLINQCTELEPRTRPKMEDVVEQLRTLKLETAPMRQHLNFRAQDIDQLLMIKNMEGVLDAMTEAWQARAVSRGGPRSALLNRIDADLVQRWNRLRLIVCTLLNHMSLNHEGARQDGLAIGGVRGSDSGTVYGIAFDVACLRWPVPASVCLLPAHEGVLSEEDRSYSSWSGRLRNFCQEGRTSNEGVLGTKLRLFFLCGHDMSLAECGHEGQGYEVDKLLAWLKDRNLPKMVGYMLGKIALKVCTGLAVPADQIDSIFGTTFGGVTSIVVEDMGDVSVESLSDNDDWEWRGTSDPPKMAPVEADRFMYELLKDVIRTFELAELAKRRDLTFRCFRSGMQLVDRGGHGVEWKWVRERNLHAFANET